MRALDPCFRIHTENHDRPIIGVESGVLTIPTALCPGVDGQRVLLVPALGKFLRGVSEQMAEGNGMELHHAEWTISKDPELVTEITMHDDPSCVACRAGLDQALAYLKEKDEEIFVGLLYWAGSKWCPVCAPGEVEGSGVLCERHQ